MGWEWRDWRLGPGPSGYHILAGVNGCREGSRQGITVGRGMGSKPLGLIAGVIEPGKRPYPGPKFRICPEQYVTEI